MSNNGSTLGTCWKGLASDHVTRGDNLNQPGFLPVKLRSASARHLHQPTSFPSCLTIAATMDEQTANKCEHVVALLSEIPTMSDVPRALPFDAPTPLQDRLSKVLDAFANLLVSQPRREVIAVGMQIFTSTDTTKYAIVIGSNSSIPEDTVSHCRAIVSQLQDLGHHFYHMRKASYDNPAVIEMESERSRSPPLDETSFTPEVRSLVRKLKTQIHDFSLPKLKQRLNKPSGNGTRITAFQEYVSKLPDSENTTIVILKRIATILSFVSTFLGNQNSSLDTTTPDSLRFIEGMDRVCDMVQELFQTETWMIRLSAIASEPSKLICPIQTDEQTYILILF
jgi:hypothetical protein